MRHRRSGESEVTETSRLTRTERQRKTKENVEGRPVGARRSGGRWRGSNTWAPGSGPRIAFSKPARPLREGVTEGVTEKDGFTKNTILMVSFLNFHHEAFELRHLIFQLVAIGIE